MPIPEAAVAVSVPVAVEAPAEPLPDGPVALVLVTEPPGGPCALAPAEVHAGVVSASLVDAALADWLSRSRPVRAVAREALPPPCDGVPPVDGLVVGADGTVIGLRGPAGSPASDGGVSVASIGDDGVWWRVRAAVAAEPGHLVLQPTDPRDPPVRFAVKRVGDEVAVPGPAGRPVSVPLGGASLVDCEALSYVDPTETGPVGAIVVGRSVALVGRGAGQAKIVVRCGSAPPTPLDVEVGPPLGPNQGGGEVVVPVGGRRRFSAGGAVIGAWIADPTRATVEVRGGRIAIAGLAPGRTSLVLGRAGGDAFVLPVTVGN